MGDGGNLHPFATEGGPGGGGSYVERIYPAGTLTPGAVIAGVVGAPGAAGTNPEASPGLRGEAQFTWT